MVEEEDSSAVVTQVFSEDVGSFIPPTSTEREPGAALVVVSS